jgi:hypothetical protein
MSDTWLGMNNISQTIMVISLVVLGDVLPLSMWGVFIPRVKVVRHKELKKAGVVVLNI